MPGPQDRDLESGSWRICTYYYTGAVLVGGAVARWLKGGCSVCLAWFASVCGLGSVVLCVGSPQASSLEVGWCLRVGGEVTGDRSGVALAVSGGRAYKRVASADSQICQYQLCCAFRSAPINRVQLLHDLSLCSTTPVPWNDFKVFAFSRRLFFVSLTRGQLGFSGPRFAFGDFVMVAL